MSKINLSQNKIGPTINVWPDLKFESEASKLYVDLSKNEIKHISYTTLLEAEESLIVYNFPELLHKIEVDVSENPLECDCQNFDLFRHLDSLTSERQFKISFDSLATKWFKFTKALKTGKKMCQTTENSVHFSCTFPSENLPDHCPKSCVCSYIPFTSLSDYNGHIIIDCSRSEKMSLPDFIPSKLGINEIKTISLNLSHKALSSWNSLHKIPGFFNVTELDVSYNNLTRMPQNLKSDWLTQTSLKKIHLDHNFITNFKTETIDQKHLDGLEELWLGDNPYSCDCDSELLYNFISQNSAKISDRDSVFLNCENGNIKISQYNDTSDFCSKWENPDIAIAVGLPAFLVALVILILLVLFLTYRETIYILIYNNPWFRSWLFLYDDESDNKNFDVFISYSHFDKDFVEDFMVPKLEDDPDDELKYRLECPKF